jgi:hypothetical protein
MDRLLMRIVAKSSGCISAWGQHSVDLHAAPGRPGLLTDNLALQSTTIPIALHKFEETWVVYQRVAASVSLPPRTELAVACRFAGLRRRS